MKNRNLDHKDDWATPPEFYEKWNKKYCFDFDPCPYQHNLLEWNGLEIDWRERNFINPPYSRILKELFIMKSYKQGVEKKKFCFMLLPVSTSTVIFHKIIKPFAEINFVEKRIPFIGINSKGEYVNWHLWDRKAPREAIHVKNSGQHDSMIVIFNKKY